MSIRKTAASDQPGLAVEGDQIEKTAAGVNWREEDERELERESADDRPGGR